MGVKTTGGEYCAEGSATVVEGVVLGVDWTYPDVADKFRLRHRNLLHCSLLILSRAQVA